MNLVKQCECGKDNCNCNNEQSKMWYTYTCQSAQNIYTQDPLNYATAESAGFDIRANSLKNFNSTTGKLEGVTWETNAEPLEQGSQQSTNSQPCYYLKPGERILVGSGLKAKVEKGYEMQVRPRSGLALKHGITVVNSPGTIDSDYRGEIGVILLNTDNKKSFPLHFADRIAQIVINKVEQMPLVYVQNLDDTARGDGGYGSTGLK